MMSDSWNSQFLDELAGVPEVEHDDQADAVSTAFNYLAANPALDYGISFLRV